MSGDSKLQDALTILKAIGLPRQQLNERSALVLLALVDLRPSGRWREASSPLIGISPIIDWLRVHYEKVYAPNTRETVRRETMHQFIRAGIALYNPDAPKRPVNSPKAVYQVEPRFLAALKTYGTRAWAREIAEFLERQERLAARYERDREQRRVPVILGSGTELMLSGGEHSELIRDIVEDFGARFAGGGQLVYAGDTGAKRGYVDEALLSELGVDVDAHGKMPDVIIYDRQRDWLFLVEAVTSHGPVDGKRHDELMELFGKGSAGLVYVTAFPNRTTMARYVGSIAWETEVWIAESPSHLIHFNGDRFLGPR
jgi:hypothetical protein